MWLAGEFCRAVARAPGPLHRGAPSRNGPENDFWSLVGFAPHLSCLVSIFSLPHRSLVSLFPSTIPCYAIDSRTSLRIGRVIPIPFPYAALTVRTIANTTAIAPSRARLLFTQSYPFSLMDNVFYLPENFSYMAWILLYI